MRVRGGASLRASRPLDRLRTDPQGRLAHRQGGTQIRRVPRAGDAAVAQRLQERREPDDLVGVERPAGQHGLGGDETRCFDRRARVRLGVRIDDALAAELREAGEGEVEGVDAAAWIGMIGDRIFERLEAAGVAIGCRLAHVEQARSAERVEPGRVLRGEKVTQIRLVRAQEAPAELRKADVVKRFVREPVSRMTPGTPQRTVRRSLEEQ